MSAMSEAGSTVAWSVVDSNETQSIQLGQTQSIQPVHHFASPWAEAGIDPTSELQTYISDAKARWSQLLPVVRSSQLAVACKDNGCDAMEVDVKGQEMLTTIQKALPENMVAFRTLILKMAKTIVELMRAPANDEMNKELEIDTGKAEACYMLAMKVMEEQEKTFSCGFDTAMEKHRSAMEKHRSAKWPVSSPPRRASSEKRTTSYSRVVPEVLIFFGCLLLASQLPQGVFVVLGFITSVMLGVCYAAAAAYARQRDRQRQVQASKEQEANQQLRLANQQLRLVEMFSKNKKSLAHCKVLWQGDGREAGASPIERVQGNRRGSRGAPEGCAVRAAQGALWDASCHGGVHDPC
eukprot:3413910-Amphidinium_carterae.1